MAYNVLKPVYTPAGVSVWYSEDGGMHRTEQFSVRFVKVGELHYKGATKKALQFAKERFGEKLRGEPPVLERVK